MQREPRKPPVRGKHGGLDYRDIRCQKFGGSHKGVSGMGVGGLIDQQGLAVMGRGRMFDQAAGSCPGDEAAVMPREGDGRMGG